MSKGYRDAFPAEVWTGSGNVGRAGFLPNLPASAVLDLTAHTHAERVARFRALLDAGIHGISFSPYLDGQRPGIDISEDQIRDRMAIIRPHTRWIRTFSCTEGNAASARIAHEMGLKTMVGVELCGDRTKNDEELEAGLEIARAGHADILAVGNEVLLRGDLSSDEVVAYIQRARESAPGVTISYVDAYFLFENHPNVAEACDVLLINCYPFWERCPLEYSLPYMQEMVRRTQAVAGGKKIIISETGWPSVGTPYGGAIPGEENALAYFVQAYEWAAREGIEIFYFSSFDEKWKTGAEGDVGSSWGLWDSAGQLKYV